MKIVRNEVTYYATFMELMQAFEKNYKNQPAITEYSRFGEASTKTYGDLAADVSAFIEVAHYRGYRDKNMIILGENSYEWLVCYFGAAASKNRAVCIDTEQSDEVIEAMIRHIGPDVIFCSPTFETLCKKVAEDTPDCPVVLMNSQKEEQLCVSYALARGREWAKKEGSKAHLVQTDPEETAVIVFTSGTTAQPKSVMLSQKAVLYNAADGLSHLWTGQKCFISLPFYHTYSICCLLISMLHGAHVTINGNMKTLFRDMKKCRPEAIAAVPLMVETLYAQMWLAAERAGKKEAMRKLLDLNLKLKKLGLSFGTKKLIQAKEEMLGPLRFSTCGGAHISKQICEELDLFGIRIIQGYGITECAPIIALNGNHFCKMGSVGQVIPHAKVKLVEEEIWVQGDCIMNGYYKDAALTEEVMEDGWFKTGDLGYIDAQGFLFITGRKKDLIVFKNGKKIFPEQMENKIAQMPYVKENVVYGTIIGEDKDEVKLAVSIFADPEQTEGMESYAVLDAINQEIEKLNEILPFYQKIQLVTLRKTPFEKTSQGKIKRDHI